MFRNCRPFWSRGSRSRSSRPARKRRFACIGKAWRQIVRPHRKFGRLRLNFLRELRPTEEDCAGRPRSTRWEGWRLSRSSVCGRARTIVGIGSFSHKLRSAKKQHRRFVIHSDPRDAKRPPAAKQKAFPAWTTASGRVPLGEARLRPQISDIPVPLTGNSAHFSCSSDSLIAQTCLDRGVRLLTRDRDFRAFAEAAGLNILVRT